jgi:hypothetical protein
MDVVDRAPELLRWCDFSNPFPPVAMGGYRRYYINSIPTILEAPSYCPLLSQEPNPYPAREIPPTSPLFSSPAPPKRPLTVIHEPSVDPMAPRKPRNLSLRRQHHRLLRTPSIKRDFAVHAQHLLASSPSSIDRTWSHRSSHSHSSAQSDLSNQSDSMHSDASNNSNFPITPSTSVDSEDEDYIFVFVDGQLETKGTYEQNRPLSGSSFSTARSNFSDDIY